MISAGPDDDRLDDRRIRMHRALAREAEALRQAAAEEKVTAQRRQRREAYRRITSARIRLELERDLPPATVRTYDRRGLAERAGTAPISAETASKLQRIVHFGDEHDKAVIERVMLGAGYEAGSAGFTPNDIRPHLRIDGTWTVNRYLVSGMYSTLCSEGLAEAIGSTRIHDSGSGNEGTACNRYRLTPRGRRYAREHYGVDDASSVGRAMTPPGRAGRTPAPEDESYLLGDLHVEERSTQTNRRRPRLS